MAQKALQQCFSCRLGGLFIVSFQDGATHSDMRGGRLQINAMTAPRGVFWSNQANVLTNKAADSTAGHCSNRVLLEQLLHELTGFLGEE
jgi:hypothetical protein